MDDSSEDKLVHGERGSLTVETESMTAVISSSSVSMVRCVDRTDELSNSPTTFLIE